MGIKNLVRVVKSPAIVAKIQAWDNMDFAQRSAAYAAALKAGGAKTVRKTKPGYLIPIVLGIGKKTVVKCRILDQASGGTASSGLPAELKTITTGRVFDTITDAGTDFDLTPFSGFKRPARVTLIVKTPSSTSRVSRITGREYKGPETDSASQSFGADKAGTAQSQNDYDTVHVAAEKAVGSATNKSYKITPEGGR